MFTLIVKSCTHLFAFFSQSIPGSGTALWLEHRVVAVGLDYKKVSVQDQPSDWRPGCGNGPLDINKVVSMTSHLVGDRVVIMGPCIKDNATLSEFRKLGGPDRAVFLMIWK